MKSNDKITKSTKKMPVLFTGHGSPMNAIGNNKARPVWKNIGETLPKPKVIIAIFAHWATRRLFVRNAADNPQSEVVEVSRMHGIGLGRRDGKGEKIDGCDVVAGDFNGDGKTELAAVYADKWKDSDAYPTVQTYEWKVPDSAAPRRGWMTTLSGWAARRLRWCTSRTTG